MTELNQRIGIVLLLNYTYLLDELVMNEREFDEFERIQITDQLISQIEENIHTHKL
jgi:hypothetical protein